MFWDSQESLLSLEKRVCYFINDHKRFCWAYLMYENYEVEKFLKEFYMMIEVQFQTKISILHSDNGTEYFNKILGNF